MKQIQLKSSNGVFTLVDDELYEYLSQYTWWISRKINTSYAYITLDGKTVNMHQLVLPIEDPKLTPDHINGNGLDNRRENLRVATKSQQQFNRRKFVKASSKYKGVRWHPLKKKWYAQIEKQIKGKRKCFHLGVFLTEIEAARAYNEKALKLFGEFAVLNEFNVPLKEEEFSK